MVMFRRYYLWYDLRRPMGADQGGMFWHVTKVCGGGVLTSVGSLWEWKPAGSTQQASYASKTTVVHFTQCPLRSIGPKEMENIIGRSHKYDDWTSSQTDPPTIVIQGCCANVTSSRLGINSERFRLQVPYITFGVLS